MGTIVETDRQTRYQGAIISKHCLLLIKEYERATGKSNWFLPGGGIETGESPEECVRREMKEETGLQVEVEGLLLDGPEVMKIGPYRRHLTYLCHPISGKAKAGFEPRGIVEGHFTITGFSWFDLHDESGWNLEIIRDHVAFLYVQLIRKKLGYVS